jgi:Ion channel
MSETDATSRRPWRKRPPFYLVLVCLIALLVVASIISAAGTSGSPRALSLLGLLVSLLAISAAGEAPRLRGAVLVLAAVSVIANAGGLWHVMGLPGQPGVAVSLTLLALTTLILFAGVMRSEQVTGDVIAGAVATYLMIGLTWAFAYGLAESIWPGAISAGGTSLAGGSAHTLLYFSYTTLMTIGYGDVVPVHPVARILAVLEGLAGVGFTTIVLAFLVALRVSSASRGDNRRG